MRIELPSQGQRTPDHKAQAVVPTAEELRVEKEGQTTKTDEPVTKQIDEEDKEGDQHVREDVMEEAVREGEEGSLTQSAWPVCCVARRRRWTRCTGR